MAVGAWLLNRWGSYHKASLRSWRVVRRNLGACVTVYFPRRQTRQWMKTRCNVIVTRNTIQIYTIRGPASLDPQSWLATDARLRASRSRRSRDHHISLVMGTSLNWENLTICSVQRCHLANPGPSSNIAVRTCYTYRHTSLLFYPQHITISPPFTTLADIMK